MSGAEAMAVLGLISSVIDICQACKKIADIARSTQGLAEHMEKASEALEKYIIVLNEAKSEQTKAQSRGDFTDSRQAEAIMASCEESAKKLQKILQSIRRPQDWSRMRKLLAACKAVMFDRKEEVGGLIVDIGMNLDQLHKLKSFQSMTTVEEMFQVVRQIYATVSSTQAEKDGHNSQPQPVNQTWKASQYNTNNMTEGNSNKINHGNINKINNGHINKGNVNYGNINYGNINHGNINHGNINHGNINNGSINKFTSAPGSTNVNQGYVFMSGNATQTTTFG